ncbi:aldehyde dehydrogenase (NADP(+)) [Pseudonocardia sp. GCM10023141]|uniref:aldehyde dehydrogenase (NADP(+)) n=1 Tax=Pseudonocardia sp. GCM10023141 TaxID=3252653 RepID=UPI0036159C4F
MTADVMSMNPRTGVAEGPVAEETEPAEVLKLTHDAAEAAGWLDGLGRAGRAVLLDAIAAELEADGETIIAVADRESALGTARLTGELARTCFQLRFFGEVLRDGGYLEVIIDHADPSSTPPLPDLRRLLVPIGPVSVFGASNFPLAFSVPGGDTASALAAGCPVLVKAHPAHPETAILCAAAIERALRAAEAPSGVFTLVHGQEAGAALVTDPRVRAVGFTGSTRGGRALFDLAASRPEPIPFYGELGSVNPLVVTPGAAAERAEEIGKGAAGSMLLGMGQFCTKPGLLFVPAGENGDVVVSALAAGVGVAASGALLTAGIRAAFREGTARLAGLPGVEVLEARAGLTGEAATGPVLLQVGTDRLGEDGLLEEQFGPFAIIVRYAGEQDLLAALEKLPGALTATVHGTETEPELTSALFSRMRRLAGRILWNGYPTGVAVSWAMQHGGPYPAATSADHTSVGSGAIRRWLRPVTYQSAPPAVLPAELREDGPAGLPRRVDGKFELA